MYGHNETTIADPYASISIPVPSPTDSGGTGGISEPTASPTETPPGRSLGGGPIAGIVIGSLWGAVAIAIICYFVYKHFFGPAPNNNIPLQLVPPGPPGSPPPGLPSAGLSTSVPPAQSPQRHQTTDRRPARQDGEVPQRGDQVQEVTLKPEGIQGDSGVGSSAAPTPQRTPGEETRNPMIEGQAQDSGNGNQRSEEAARAAIEEVDAPSNSREHGVREQPIVYGAEFQDT